MPNAALLKAKRSHGRCLKITLCDQSFLKGMAADGRAQVLSPTCVCTSQDVFWLYTRSVWTLTKNRRGGIIQDQMILRKVATCCLLFSLFEYLQRRKTFSFFHLVLLILKKKKRAQNTYKCGTD